MNAPHTRDPDSSTTEDSDTDATAALDDARRETLVDRLRAVPEPSSSVDHLLERLTGARPAARMTVVDWTLPLARTDGDVALRVVRSDGRTAYLGFADGDFRATPWRPVSDDAAADGFDASERAGVDPREWFPEDARVVPLPVEETPFDG